MRPLRLEVRGFTAFRDAQAIDLEGFDLFAIAGPTGAGKSSLLDAMTYALYGKVERLGGGSVAQLISQGLPVMSVLLEFQVEGRRYRVTRETRRPGKTAAPSKAVLERHDGEEWIDEGGGIREVEERVRKIVGLDYEGFTRAVLLPQGKFDQFLTGDAPIRRRILTDLLGLELWERMARHANMESAKAKGKREMNEGYLARDFAGVSEEAASAERAAAKEHRAREETAGTALEKVREIVKRRDAVRAAARDMENAAQEARAAATAATNVAKTLAELPAARAKAEAILAGSRKSVTAAEAKAKKAEAERAAAVKKWGRTRDLLALLGRAEQYMEHSTLKKGDVCPTCKRVLTEAPKPPAALAKQLTEALGKIPPDPAKALRERADRLEELEEAARGAASEKTNAEQAVSRAERTLEQLDGRAATEHARLPLGTLRSLVARAAAMAPDAKPPTIPARAPAPDSDELPAFAADLAKTATLLAKAFEGAARPTGEAGFMAEAQKTVSDIGLMPARDLDSLAKLVEVAVRSAAEEAREAEVRAKEIEKDLVRKAELEAETAQLRAREATMHALAIDLKGDAIVGFVQGEALRTLAREGSEQLKYLSRGRYGLRYRGDEFYVADGANGEEDRSVRTLSGGESFLASLALALTLSEQVRALATTEHARLDSLFIDEGFGSLDADALETATEALERLGKDGNRMVGVISHIPELTERMPTRIVVEKVGSSSRVATSA